MEYKGIRIAVTVMATGAAIAHVLLPGLEIDAIAVALLAIAAGPWLAPLFKSLEVPGVRIEFRDLQEAARRAEKAGLLESRGATVAEAPYSFELVAEDDPNLALAGLRIEIEKRLRELARASDLPVERRGVGNLLRALDRADVLSADERGVMGDLLGLLNSSVHGATVDDRAAEWALEIGPQILGALDRRIRRLPEPETANAG